MPMNQPLTRKPPKPRFSIRIDARLDPSTRAKVDELATRFHQPRAVVLCHIMHWGLSHGDTLACAQGDVEGPVCHLSLYVPSGLHAQVQEAAIAAGVKAAPWLRRMVRQITIQDFPASWQEATPRERSHESHTSTARFMLRLDEPSETKLQQLINRFGTSKAAIIRHLLTHATPEDFPRTWPHAGRRAPWPPRVAGILVRKHTLSHKCLF
jgi:hypothetical protein